jgi:allophanate hydrolase
VPTVPTIYTRAALEADPIARNAHLGLYTNFVNLLDLCALAVPAGFRADGLPHGITLVGPAWSDAGLAAFGDRWQRACDLPLGATGQRIGEAEPAIVAPQAPVVRLAVVGAHLRGQPLNAELTARGARFAGEARTCARYRLYALAGTRPPKPGLVRAPDGRGAPIAVELWDLSPAAFGELVSEIPPPLGVGSVELEDGRWVKGFLCEAHALQAALDISEFGGWRRYLEARHPSLAATKGAEP